MTRMNLLEVQCHSQVGPRAVIVLDSLHDGCTCVLYRIILLPVLLVFSSILDRVSVMQEAQLRYTGPNLNMTTLGVLQ
jgi:hypothetical protein